MSDAPGPLDRVGGILDLLTSLDRRVISALDSLEEVRSALASLGPDARGLVGDVQIRIARLDDRLNRDLDEIKTTILEKLHGLDLEGLGPRFNRLEEAVLNIERATVNLDRLVQGAMEMMPDFMTRRMKTEGRKAAPVRRPEEPEPPRD